MGSGKLICDSSYTRLTHFSFKRGSVCAKWVNELNSIRKWIVLLFECNLILTGGFNWVSMSLEAYCTSKVAYKALYWHNCIHSSNLIVCKLCPWVFSWSPPLIPKSLLPGARFFGYSPWINQWGCARKSLSQSFLSTQKPELSTISLTPISAQMNTIQPYLK